MTNHKQETQNYNEWYDGDWARMTDAERERYVLDRYNRLRRQDEGNPELPVLMSRLGFIQERIEQEEAFEEWLNGMSGEQLIEYMRTTSEKLAADGGKLARELGLPPDHLESVDKHTHEFERSVELAKIAEARLIASENNVNRAADRILSLLDDSNAKSLFIPPRSSGKKGN